MATHTIIDPNGSTHIIDTGLVAASSGATLTRPTAIPASPPDEWFLPPNGHTAAYDVQIEDDGRVHGYPAATWDTCHLSFDQCVTPPRSATDYSYFKVGQTRTASGARIKTGPLTLKGGHADRGLSAAQAQAFYDDTDSAFADVAIGEDEFGIWIAGALRPDTTPGALRAAMGSGFSGDWRWVGEGYELIALSAVNTPGFRRRVDLHEGDGVTASLIIDMPSHDESEEVIVSTTTTRSEFVPVSDEVDAGEVDAMLASVVNRIAASIGRTPEQRQANQADETARQIRRLIASGERPERRKEGSDRRVADRRVSAAADPRKKRANRQRVAKTIHNDRRVPEGGHKAKRL